MRHHHSPGIRGQLMWFLCCICLFLLALVWFLSTQLLEPLYTKHIEKQLTTQAESITAELDKAIDNGEAFRHGLLAILRSTPRFLTGLPPSCTPAVR